MSFVPIRKYNKDQIILNSNRIVINAKDDNIFLTASKDIAMSCEGDVHVNANSYIVNAKKIQLGINNNQPVPKGTDLSNMLNNLINALNNLASDLTSASGFGVGTISTPTINSAGVKLQGELRIIQDLVKKINSTVTFTS